MTAPARLPADTPIERLTISLRTLGFLEGSGYTTVGDLAGATDEELRDVRGIGPVALHEIRGALRAGGYPRGGAR